MNRKFKVFVSGTGFAGQDIPFGWSHRKEDGGARLNNNFTAECEKRRFFNH